MAALHCSFPSSVFITSHSHNPTILFPNHSSSSFRRPILKSHRPKFPIISAAVKPPTPVWEILADQWRDIMGKNHWKGLLDPMDHLLRRELIKYAEFCTCTYEAFVGDVCARNYGICKYQTFDFFDNMSLIHDHGYDVTKHIYCTTNKTWWPKWIAKPVNPRTWKETNVWMGFIAVSDDATSKVLGRRDICIVWRGTNTMLEWLNDFLSKLVHLPAEMPSPDSRIRVEDGFLTMYTHKDDVDFSARGLVLSEVKRLVNQVYPNEELSITVTGHSLGAAMATLCAYDIAESGANKRDPGSVPVCAITYAGPKVGNPHFKDRLEELGVKVLRIVNEPDLVPKAPGLLGSESFIRGLDLLGHFWAYLHVGVELVFDSQKSANLKPLPPLTHVEARFSAAHDLEVYMHMIDGYQGKYKKFQSATGRDLALINKYNDLLTDDHLVPPGWRVDLNKSMVKYKGCWVHESTVNYFQDNK